MEKEYWFEVFKDLGDLDGTETIELFDTEQESIDFINTFPIEERKNLNYDEWEMNSDGSGVAKRNKIK